MEESCFQFCSSLFCIHATKKSSLPFGIIAVYRMYRKLLAICRDASDDPIHSDADAVYRFIGWAVRERHATDFLYSACHIKTESPLLSQNTESEFY